MVSTPSRQAGTQTWSVRERQVEVCVELGRSRLTVTCRVPSLACRGAADFGRRWTPSRRACTRTWSVEELQVEVSVEPGRCQFGSDVTCPWPGP